MTRNYVTVAAIVCGLLIAGAAPAFTIDEQVIVANRLIHPIRAGAGGLSAVERVARINERLNKIMATESLLPSNIHVSRVGGDPGIFVGRSLVTTVTEADAQANNTTPAALANRWLSAYRSVLPQARPNGGQP